MAKQFKYNPFLYGKINANTKTSFTRQVSDSVLERNLGLIEGQNLFYKVGFNPTVADTYEEINQSSIVYPFPITTEPIRIRAGGNAADTAAGLGARSVLIPVLDEDWILQHVTLSTLGALASLDSPFDVVRVLDAQVASTGAYGVGNTAAILIENNPAVQLLATIGTGVSKSFLSTFSVEADKFAKIDSLMFVVSEGAAADIRFSYRERADILTAPFSPAVVWTEFNDVTGVVPININAWPDFPEKCDMWFSAKNHDAGVVAQVTIMYSVIVFDRVTT